MSKLLDRQVKKYLETFSEKELDKLKPFLTVIEEAYVEFENDKALTERSMDISSKELLEKNDMLKK